MNTMLMILMMVMMVMVVMMIYKLHRHFTGMVRFTNSLQTKMKMATMMKIIVVKFTMINALSRDTPMAIGHMAIFGHIFGLQPKNCEISNSGGNI